MKSYDIALSFAGEDRTYVEEVADALRQFGISVFYDRYEQVSLWGQNLYDQLTEVYQNRARFTVMFISRHYADKVFPNQERQSAQARALQEHREYVLPVRFDDTVIPGLLPTICYLDLNEISPQELARMIKQKLELADLPRTAYGALNNQQIIAKALDLVRKMRAVVHRHELGEEERRTKASMLGFIDRSRFGDTEGTVQRSIALLKLKHTFESEFKAEAVLIRLELERRLPAHPSLPREKGVERYYEYVTSAHDLREVIDDIELLAKSVPL